MPEEPPGILDPETVIAVIAVAVFAGGATDLDEGLHGIVRMPCPLPMLLIDMR